MVQIVLGKSQVIEEHVGTQPAIQSLGSEELISHATRLGDDAPDRGPGELVVRSYT
jgi:hypothetical protein